MHTTGMHQLKAMKLSCVGSSLVIWPPVTSFYFQKLIEAKSTPV
jgi:hypothetical protein